MSDKPATDLPTADDAPGVVSRDLLALFREGQLVHVFAGHQGHLMRQRSGETLLEMIARAAAESKNGDVWITPHWC